MQSKGCKEKGTDSKPDQLISVMNFSVSKRAIPTHLAGLQASQLAVISAAKCTRFESVYELNTIVARVSVLVSCDQ